MNLAASAVVRDNGWIVPDWPAPPTVNALMTTRAGGTSPPPWGAAPGGGGGMNLGAHTGDDPACVAANRARLRSLLPAAPRWLAQVHGAAVVDAESVSAEPATADASTAADEGCVCAVLAADCLPVLLTDVNGVAVAAAHAGWRGLAAGVLQNAAMALRRRLLQRVRGEAELIAWLGPAIGPARFEVGPEVRAAMQAALPQAAQAFEAAPGGKWHADLFALARQALAQASVLRVYGGGVCTASDAARFYSYRRDGQTGRQAALIWRTAPDRTCARSTGD